MDRLQFLLCCHCAVSPCLSCKFSMIVHDLDFVGVAIPPLEANAPLVIERNFGSVQANDARCSVWGEKLIQFAIWDLLDDFFALLRLWGTSGVLGFSLDWKSG